jgi:hypothetical protein
MAVMLLPHLFVIIAILVREMATTSAILVQIRASPVLIKNTISERGFMTPNVAYS